MSRSLNLADLGRRVRTARLARRLTLEEVVSRTGFTASWLSKVETGQLAPSLDGLVTLANVLECGVDSLVEGLSAPPRFVVVKHGRGTVMPIRPGRGVTVETLADQWRDRAMNPLILHLSGAGARRQPDNHDGERFLLVLEGAVNIVYGDERIELDQGDSIYLFAAIPHLIAPLGKQAARVLSVSYEPDARGRGAAGDATRVRRPD